MPMLFALELPAAPWRHVSASGIIWRVPDAIKKFLPAIAPLRHSQVNAAAANRGRRVGFVSQLILRDGLEVPRSRLEYKRLAADVRRVYPAADHDGRGKEVTAEPLLPQFLARVRFPADRHAGIHHGVKMAILLDHGWNIDPRIVLPSDPSGAIRENGH